MHTRPLNVLLFSALCVTSFVVSLALLSSAHAHASAAASYTLTIKPYNAQTGQDLGIATITSLPAGIDCGQGHTQCSANFNEGTSITLSASGYNPNDVAFTWYPDVRFFHSSVIYGASYAACDGERNGSNSPSPMCQMTMPQHNVSFSTQAIYTHSILNVKKSGDGSGRVTNQYPVKPPLIIDCGTTCSADINAGLILFPIPDPGSSFAGWQISDSQAENYCTYDKSGNPNCATSYEVHPRANGQAATYTAIFSKLKIGTSDATPRVASGSSAPAAPLVTVKSNNRVLNEGTHPSVGSQQTLALSGKTLPNGQVTIYLYSAPRTYHTTADTSGDWSLEIKDLPAGQHHLEAEVTDPRTNSTSFRTMVLAFSVKDDPARQQAAASRKPAWPLATIAITVILVAAAAMVIMLHRRKKLQRANSAKPAARSRKARRFGIQKR